ncbi:MAG: hypothetical protein K5773_04925 [Pseudobutyrivibrio sp.]|nr:hypothetical protein [Pseudobutyrivibrio sp.]
MKIFKTSKLLKSMTAFALAFVMAFSVPVTAEAATQGIDVSKYQGAINWAAVAQSGVSYAFIKVGSTNSGVDPYFAANVKGAQAAGVRTGVYIYSYATSVQAAAQEAALVLQWIEPYGINFPVAFDIEDKTQKGLDANTCTAMANTFCSIISAAGYTPMVYTYTNFYKSHFTSALAYDKWIAQYSDHNDIAGWAIWQYSSGGSVPGINGRVDMNVAVKDYTQWIPQVGLLPTPQGTFLFNNYRRQFNYANIGGYLFHTDPTTGIVTYGWHPDPALGTYYFSPETAAAVTGLQSIDGAVYYFDESFRLYSGWLDLGGNMFLFNPNDGSKLYTGWWTDSAGVRYLDTTDGHMHRGLSVIDKDIYYFNQDGIRQVGWVDVNGATFLFNPLDNGKLYKGWWTDATGTYYLDATDAHKTTGLAAIDGNVYYFNDNGQMQVGAFNLNGATWYFGADGKLVKNSFENVGGALYYFGADGKMVTGCFQAADGQIYYANEKGVIVTNQVITVGSNPYLFGADGKLVKNQLIQVGNMLYQTNEAGVVTATAPAQ